MSSGRRPVTSLLPLLARFARDERGGTAVEYSLIAIILGVSIITMVDGLAPAFNEHLNEVSTNLQ